MPSTSTQNTIQELLSLYPQQNLPLHLSTKELTVSSKSKGNFVEGKLIPEQFLSVFGKVIKSEGNDVFAVTKVPLPNQKIGLITRVPGMYTSSKLMLFVLDLKSGAITGKCEVAETFGDAGDSYVRTSDIKWDANKDLLIAINQQNCAPTNGDDLNSVACVDSTLTYQLRDSQLALLSRKPKA